MTLTFEFTLDAPFALSCLTTSPCAATLVYNLAHSLGSASTAADDDDDDVAAAVDDDADAAGGAEPFLDLLLSLDFFSFFLLSFWKNNKIISYIYTVIDL